MRAFVTSGIPVVGRERGSAGSLDGVQFRRSCGTAKPGWQWHVRKCRPRAAKPRAPTMGMSEATPLVDELLSCVATTDGGPSTPADQRSRVDKLVSALSELGRERKHLADPRLFDNYSVAYTSSSGDQQGRGAPAGGRFRGRVGRLLFVSRGIFQHIYSPNTVVNLVAFRLFGVIRGAVGLKGRLTPTAELGSNGVQVDFERPRISLGRLVFAFGPPSQVKLKTTYLDERVRLGIGSRGSLFVFTKDAAARSAVAQEWKLLFSPDARGPRLIPIAALPAAAAAVLGACAFVSPLAGLGTLALLAAVARSLRVTYSGTPKD